MRFVGRIGVAVLLAAAVSACATEREPMQVQLPARPPLTQEDGGPPDLGPADRAAAAAEAAREAEPILSYGSGQPVRRTPDPGRQILASEDGVVLAFDRAPIAEVVDVVVGEYLGAEFSIDPTVQGEITLRSSGPVPLADVPAALDRALGLSGYSLIESAPGAYTVAPSTAVGAGVGVTRRPAYPGEPLSPGFDYLIAPLRYVSASDMARLVQPFAPPGGVVQVDSTREMLVLAGDSTQLAAMMDTIAMFDVDWMAQASFGMFPLNAAPPDALVEELQEVFGGESGPVGSQIEFISLPRLNSILVIANQPERLEQARGWISQLDRRSRGTGRAIRFLRIRNGDAEELAEDIADLVIADAAVPEAEGEEGGDDHGGGGEEQQAAATPLTVRAHAATNSLIVTATDEEFRQIEELVAYLDHLPDQVLIEATIAEVTLNDQLRYGVQWFLDLRNDSSLTLTDLDDGSIAGAFPGFAYQIDDTYVQAALNLLDTVTDVEVVSAPQIVTLDNQTARLQVGDEVPIITQTAVSVSNPDSPLVNSVQFRNTGVVLQVTPRVNEGSTVILDIEQEVSEVTETTTSGIDSPTIQQRKFESTVAVGDGETVALGGLIRSNRTVGSSGLPVLKDIPVLGTAFGNTTEGYRRTELIVFLTPRIIRTREDARETTDYMRSRLQGLELVFDN